MTDLLFEIGTEEIPAGYLNPALAQIETAFKAKAGEQALQFEEIKTMGTPRRLVLSVTGLIERQEDKVEELMGPSKAAGFDADGNATKAAQGFARSKGADVKDLQVVETEKGEYLMLKREVKGRETKDLLPEILLGIMETISFPKSMIWGSNDKHFARPVQWILALFGEEVVPVSYTGLSSSNSTRGHRFLSNHDQKIESANLAAFEAQLESLQVVVDFKKRRKMVVDSITVATNQKDELKDGQVAIDEKLVDTVTNLVEKPFAVCGVYDEKFLQLPPQVLITSMREHQKYFPVVDKDQNLLPAFIAVNNTEVKDIDITRKGHQRVLRARLEDALFFFESDKETSLEKLSDNLGGIIFQAKLGTMAEKCDRIVKLSRVLAEKLIPEQVDNCARAATLCKADLLSDMVGEFPSLQGVMGGAYAINDGEGEEIAQAIKEHYMPLRAGAPLPESELAKIVGLADRFDTLTGCFGIGQVPSGTADPFGLRRISLAILQIIKESDYTLSLQEIVQKALALYGDKVNGAQETVDTVMSFVKQRFINDLASAGIDPQAIDAATSVEFNDVNDVIKRIDAFTAIKSEQAFPVLAAAFKRIRNISKDNSTIDVDTQYFENDAENTLYQVFETVSVNMNQQLERKDYQQALKSMLDLKEPVDTFFDQVMVMSEDEKIRQNRLNLLTAIGNLVLQIGDISKMQEA